MNRELVGKKVANVLSFLTMAPFVIPGIVLAIGFYAAYTQSAAAAVRHRVDPDPGLRHALPADRVRQQQRGDPQHQPGAGGRGAHPRRHALHRDPPGGGAAAQAQPGRAPSSWCSFPATRELSAAIFLYSINTQVLSVLLFDKSDEGNFEMLAAIGLVLVFITVALILIGFRLMGRDFMLRRTAG